MRRCNWSVFLFSFSLFSTGCVNLERFATRILYPYEQVNKAYPTPEPPEGYGEKTFSLQQVSGESYSIHAWFYTAPVETAATVLYLHGNGESIGTLYRSGFFKKLEEFDVNFIAIDYPRYGRSTGELGEETFVGGAVAAVEFARQQFPQSRIIVWGRSLGASVATLAFAQSQSEVDSLILTSPWTSLYDVASDKMSVAKSLSPEWRKANEYDSMAVAEAINKPVLIHHGDLDRTIPVKFGRQLASHFEHADVKMVELPNREHNDIFLEKQLWDDVEEVFSR